MKKFFWLLFWLPLAGFGQQQAVPQALVKGTLLIDGVAQFGFSSSRTKYIRENATHINEPETKYFLQGGMGYFPADKFALGVNMHLSNIYAEKGGWLLLAGPFMRIYFPSRSVYFFFQTGIYFGTQRISVNLYGEAPRAYYPFLFNFEGAFGLSMPLNDYVHFELTGGYGAYSEMLDRKDHSYDYSYGIWGIKVGFSLLIPHGK